MPKIVDVDVRRREITEASYRVIERGGLGEATLGRVAAEAGLAIGSVRHYAGSHADLLRLTMDTLAADISSRLHERGRTLLSSRSDLTAGQRRAGVVDFLGELLPLDRRRRTEAVVWIAFGEAARTDRELAPVFVDAYDRVRALLRRVLNAVRPDGVGRLNRIDAERLAAVMNGLSLDAVQVPERMDEALIRALLRRELDTLLG